MHENGRFKEARGKKERTNFANETGPFYSSKEFFLYILEAEGFLLPCALLVEM